MRKNSEPRLQKRLKCSELKVIISSARLDKLNVYTSARISEGSPKEMRGFTSLDIKHHI